MDIGAATPNIPPKTEPTEAHAIPVKGDNGSRSLASQSARLPIKNPEIHPIVAPIFPVVYNTFIFFFFKKFKKKALLIYE